MVLQDIEPGPLEIHGKTTLIDCVWYLKRWIVIQVFVEHEYADIVK